MNRQENYLLEYKSIFMKKKHTHTETKRSNNEKKEKKSRKSNAVFFRYILRSYLTFFCNNFVYANVVIIIHNTFELANN